MTFELEIRSADEIAEDTRATQRAQLVARVDAHIEARARSLGYNTAVSCVSYRMSNVPSWVDEAEAFSAWRDAVWQALITMSADAEESGGALPDPDTLIAALPAWPG